MSETAVAQQTAVTFVDERKVPGDVDRAVTPLVVVFNSTAFGTLIGLLRQVQQFRVQNGEVDNFHKSLYAIEAIEVRRYGSGDEAETVYLVTAGNDELDQVMLVMEARIDAQGALKQEESWLSLLTERGIAEAH